MRQASASSGFSLLELMIVVVIIAIVSALVVPSMIGASRERRTQQAAMSVLDVIRNARGRAMYRGRAQMVEVQASGTGLRFDAYEGTQGSCRLSTFGNSSGTLDPNTRSETLDLGDAFYTRDDIVAVVSRPANMTYLRMCFTPMGGAYFGTVPLTGSNDPWSNDGTAVGSAGAFVFEVYRVQGGNDLGVRRRVVLPLGGSPRLRV